jgi:hypothetical protein
MGFQERAVETCLRDFKSGMVVETHIRDVLKSKNPNVSEFEKFVSKDNTLEVRMAAARMVAEKGRVETLIDVVLVEEDKSVLMEFLKLLSRKGAGVIALEGLITSTDTVIRDAVVEMFRKAGAVNSLFLLVFGDDDIVVKRIKRYYDEAGY